jgi:hypothetical protein
MIMTTVRAVAAPAKRATLTASFVLLLATLFAASLPVRDARAEAAGLADGAREAGRATGSVIHDVGQGAKKIGLEIGHGAATAGKEIGRVAKEGALAVGHGAAEAGKAVGHAAAEGGRELGKAVRGE